MQYLFKKFSHPLVKVAINDHQKKVSLDLAKILWVALVGGNDSEKQIYNVLDDIFKNNREANIQIASLYYLIMKKDLSEKEIKLLRFYYSIDENINSLENWLD